MDKFKKTVLKIFTLPLWLLILLTVASTVGITLVFMNGFDTHILATVVYVPAAYTLTALCFYFVRVLPKKISDMKQKIHSHPIGHKYMTDFAYKTKVSLYVSLTINLFFCVFKLISGIIYSSVWLGAVAVYYFVLSVMRFVLLRKQGENSFSEKRKSLICGVFLLLMNFALSAIIFQMMYRNKSFSYPGMMIFAVAAYTFYTVTMSIIDLVKYRKHENLTVKTAKIIRFAASLVSLLTLETAMLTQFGGGTDNTLMIAITGGTVNLIIFLFSVHLITQSKNRKKLK